MMVHLAVTDIFSYCMPFADGRKAFPFVMVGGVLDYENGWDIRKPLIKKVLELFPGAQPTVPKVCKHMCCKLLPLFSESILPLIF